MVDEKQEVSWKIRVLFPQNKPLQRAAEEYFWLARNTGQTHEESMRIMLRKLEQQKEFKDD